MYRSPSRPFLFAVSKTARCSAQQVRRAFDRLRSADVIGRFPDLLAGEPEFAQQVEIERGVVVHLETEPLQYRFPEDEDVEGVAQLEDPTERGVDLVQFGLGETFLAEYLAVYVRGTLQHRGADHVADHVFDLLFAVPERSECGRHRLVDDLEVAAPGELLELDQCEVGLDPGGVTIHLEADGSGWRDATGLRIAVAVLLAQLQREVPTAAGASSRLAGVCAGSIPITWCDNPSYSAWPAPYAARLWLRITRSMASRFSAKRANGPTAAAISADVA